MNYDLNDVNLNGQWNGKCPTCGCFMYGMSVGLKCSGCGDWVLFWADGVCRLVDGTEIPITNPE